MKYYTNIFLFLLLILNCSSTIILSHNSKLLTNQEKKRLSVILSSVIDTVSIETSRMDLHDYIDDWDDTSENMKSAVLKIRKSSGFPIKPESAYIQGLLDSENDIAAGDLKIKSYGLERIWEIQEGLRKIKFKPRKVYTTILKKYYAVKLDEIAGDQVDITLKAYVSAYNRVSKTVINTFYGHDIFERSWSKIEEVAFLYWNQYKKEWEY